MSGQTSLYGDVLDTMSTNSAEQLAYLEHRHAPGATPLFNHTASEPQVEEVDSTPE